MVNQEGAVIIVKYNFVPLLKEVVAYTQNRTRVEMDMAGLGQIAYSEPFLIKNPTREQWQAHYEQMIKRFPILGENTVSEITRRPIYMLLSKGPIGAIAIQRKVLGTTMPNRAEQGTVRWNFARQYMGEEYFACNMPVPNVMHISGNHEEARQEGRVWAQNFPKGIYLADWGLE